MLFLTFLDTTIVSVALASIQTGLHAGVSSLQWVVNGYALTFAGFMLAAGALGDRFGRRRVMLGGVAIFCAGSVLGAVAPSVPWLIAGRVVMGLGAAASEPGTLSVIRHLFPDDRVRAQALGAWAAVSGLAIALGPVIGGTLVGVAGWRAVFWFNVVVGTVIFASATATVPESSDPDTAARDPAGLLLGVVALTALTFGVIEGETAGYASPLILGLFVGGAVAAVAFVSVERRVESPLLQPSAVRRPPFDAALAVAFVISFGLFAIFFFVALYLQIIVGYSGYRTALVFLPMAAVMVAASAFTGRWVARQGAAVPMTAGCVAGGAGILVTELVLQHVSFGALAAGLSLAGAGVGVALVPVTSVALAEVPARRSGMAASAANTSRELGAVFGVAALGALVNGQLTSDLTRRLHAIGVPSSFSGLVISALETGRVPGGGKVPAGYEKQYGEIVAKVIDAAYAAFRSGLDVALLTAGALVLAAAPVAWFTLHRRPPAAAPLERGGGRPW